MSTDPRQLGDATALRTLGSGLFSASEQSIIIHQATSTSLRIALATTKGHAEVRLKLDELPELIRTLIARSGRDDLALVVTEPEPTEDPGVLACGYCGHDICECPQEAPDSA